MQCLGSEKVILGYSLLIGSLVMTIIVEDDQPEPDKMMQLAPYQSRRRLSTSWTGNLDSPSEQKSPLSVKSPDSKTGSSRSFFPRSAEVHPYMNEESPSLNDVVKNERKGEKHDRRTTKRDSIKDQLMRFKIKAGKVLEDVHDRLVEDHSSAAVAPIMAEQTVERKRGSVQLAKRLQRRLTIHQEEGPTEGELKSVDEQIERALEIMQREDTLYNYVKAEAWKTFLGKFEGSDYIQLDLFLSVIYFEQHPLIGDEDKFDLRLRIRYDEQCQRISDMTDVLMDAENLPISENASDIRDHAEALYNDVRKVSDELLSEYAALENCRNRQGYTISPLKYCLSDDDENRCAPDLTYPS
uniref:Uncharacterized protein n=1 Tax=Angiostrongylus cantonensis TaxID=6313 RepID=A0A0K0DPH0_ANGCA